MCSLSLLSRIVAPLYYHLKYKSFNTGPGYSRCSDSRRLNREYFDWIIMTTIFFGSTSEDKFLIDIIEHRFPSSNTIFDKMLSVISLILINATNGYLIYLIKNQTKSALDWMMLMDSCLCMSNSVVIIRQGYLG